MLVDLQESVAAVAECDAIADGDSGQPRDEREFIAQQWREQAAHG